jgi:hypothetical protein
VLSPLPLTAIKRPGTHRAGLFLGVSHLCCAALCCAAAEPVALRIDSLTLSPAQLPSAVVVVGNPTDAHYKGTVGLQAPAQWVLDPTQCGVSVGPGQTQRVRFHVKRGTNRSDNVYELTAFAERDGNRVTASQSVQVASAPYFKPDIDGAKDEWADAIPVTWSTSGERTVVRTYWNRRQFCLLVEVHERRFVPWQPGSSRACDAVQLAIAAEGSVTPRSLEENATRFEFLLLGDHEGAGQCFQLADLDISLAETRRQRPLDTLRFPDAQLAVRREEGITYYECSLPWRPMRDAIRPSEGRSFCLSVLVHDPDGVGVRDWGQAVGLWHEQRTQMAWSDWPGADWRGHVPFDNKTPWGLCSSKY